MFDKQQDYGGTLYRMDVILKPDGKANMAYLGGFADCLCAALKVNYGCVSRKFNKVQGCLVIHMQINYDRGTESDTAQFIVDRIDQTSV